MSRLPEGLRMLPGLLMADRFLGISVLVWLIGCGLLLPRSGLAPLMAGLVLLAGLGAIIVTRVRKAARAAARRAEADPSKSLQPPSREDASG